tara:strand:+ start:3964 stop:4722 length:759 start_codon:yes stop_codon:yes gene_type:complete
MSSPAVDIIVPNFNKGNFLEECISSVLKQSYDNWKLYIIDDYSNDNSVEILNKYADKEKINIIILKKNKGPSFCRNLGVRISKSEYIAFLDSDDYWSKDKLKNQIAFMLKNNFQFTYTDYTSFFMKNKSYLFKKTKLKENFNFKEFTRNSSINSSTMVLTRKIIKTHKFKKMQLLEDYLFKCDILKKNNIATKLNNNLAYYRILPENRSSNRIMNLVWLWKINSKFNNLTILDNIRSILGIMINSLKKYGFK